MSTEDKIQIPEAAPAPEAAAASSGNRKAKMSPGTRLGLMVSVAAVAIGVVYTLNSGQDQIALEGSRLSGGGRNIDATPGGSTQANSQRYQEIMSEANQAAAGRAAEAGATFVATPEAIMRPIDALVAEKPAEVVEAPAPVEEPKPAPTTRVINIPPTPVPPPRAQVEKPLGPSANPVQASGGQQGQEQKNPFTDKMVQQMAAVSRLHPLQGLQLQGAGDSGLISVDGTVSESLAAAGANGAADYIEMEEMIPAGTIVFAETMTSTNSDLAGSPVMVQITTGEHKGARLIGKFTVASASDQLMIEFETVAFADGRTAQTSAYAVDGFTAETAVASDVERRYLKRYGPLLAASFLTSYASAMADQEEALVQLGDEIAIVQKPRTERQSLYAGLTAATDAIGRDLIANAPKGPKIILRDGWPLAVMFVEPALVSQ